MRVTLDSSGGNG